MIKTTLYSDYTVKGNNSGDNARPELPDATGIRQERGMN